MAERVEKSWKERDVDDLHFCYLLCGVRCILSRAMSQGICAPCTQLTR